MTDNNVAIILLYIYSFILVVFSVIDMMINIDYSKSINDKDASFMNIIDTIISGKVPRGNRLFFIKLLSKMVIIASIYVLYKDVPLFAMILLLL